MNSNFLHCSSISSRWMKKNPSKYSDPTFISFWSSNMYQRGNVLALLLEYVWLLEIAVHWPLHGYLKWWLQDCGSQSHAGELHLLLVSPWHFLISPLHTGKGVWCSRSCFEYLCKPWAGGYFFPGAKEDLYGQLQNGTAFAREWLL